MTSVLLPINESTPAETVVRAMAARRRNGLVEAIHLLNVQAPLTGNAARFLSPRRIDAFQRDRGEAALAPIRQRFDAVGLEYTAHLCVGDVASTIGEASRILRVREILMGLDRDGLLGGLMTWLWVSRIRRYAAVPVVVVVAPPGELVPAFGRFNPTYSG
jgi:hypothetical protein